MIKITSFVSKRVVLNVQFFKFMFESPKMVQNSPGCKLGTKPFYALRRTFEKLVKA